MRVDDFVIVFPHKPDLLSSYFNTIMRLSFYSGLALAVLAADTTKAVDLDDFNDEAYLAQIDEADAPAHEKGW